MLIVAELGVLIGINRFVMHLEVHPGVQDVSRCRSAKRRHNREDVIFAHLV